MPQPRFVEVINVGAEASSTIAALLASGQGLVGKLSFNITDYINSTYGHDVLLQTLSEYNITSTTFEDLPVAVLNALNISAPDVPAPNGAARHLISVGLLLLVTRELLLQWRVRCLLLKYGHS